jgi:integrase
LDFATADRVMASSCIARLRPFGKSLADATSFYIDHLNTQAARQASRLMGDCIDEFIVSREADVARGEFDPKSLVQTKFRMKHLRLALGALHIGEVTGAHVRSFLDSHNAAPGTRTAIRAQLSKFFNHAKAQGWIDHNPTAAIPKIKIPRHEVSILSLPEVEQLVACALRPEFVKEVLVYLACGLWAGLRPAETSQLRWEDIHLDARSIFVRAETSKVRESRHVPINDALLSFLKPHAKPRGQQSRGPIVSAKFPGYWRRCKIAAGWNVDGHNWPSDVLRHTFASYWLSVHANRAELCEIMGNTPQVVSRFYRRPILPALGTRFFSIRHPESR